MATNRTIPLPGNPALALVVLVAGVLFAGHAGAQCAIPYQQKVAAPDPSTNRSFGDALALDGDVAFIGSQFDDYLCPEDPSCDAGSVQVFAFEAGAWVPTQRLVASAAEADEYFGVSIALGGGRALVGAYGHDTDAGPNSGFVYDFRLENGQWVEHRIIEASDPGGGSWFGWRVALEGTLAALAAQGDGAAGAVYVLRLVDDEWVEEQKLVPSDAVGNAIFGHSLAIEGGRIIIGANADAGIGSVYIYEHDGQSWVLQQKLTPPLGNLGDRFGESVAIRGTFCLVSATDENGGQDESGAVHVYWFDGQDWLHMRRLLPSDPVAAAAFGSSLVLGENIAIIGAVLQSDIGEDAGQAYTFLFDGMNWSEAARLRPAEVDEIDTFGRAVAIQGNEVMIGASGDDDPCGGGICGAGAVYVFRPLVNCDGNGAIDRCEIEGGQAQDCNANGVPDACDIAGGTSADCDGNGVPDSCDLLAGADCNDNGVPDACDITAGTSHDCNANGRPDECDPFAPPLGEQKLVAAAPAATDHYGSAVAVFGDVALVGAPQRDSQGADAGAAYVMRRANGVWAPEATLVGSDITSFDYFGCAVAAERDLVLVGAEVAPTGGVAAGAVYPFRLVNGSWVESPKITPAVLQANMRFGRSVAASGDLLLVGAPMEGVAGAGQRGAAYVFRHDGLAWVEEAKLTAPVFAAGDQFGASVAIDGDLAVVGEPWDDDVNNGAGAAHVFRFDGTSWVHEAKLTNPAGAAFDYLGTSVAVSGDRVAVGALRGTVGGQALGAVYVHHFDGQAWAPEATLTTGTAQPLSWFGCSTSMAGSTLLVGAYAADVGQVRSGAAFLFELAGGQWTPRATLQTSDLAASDEVGFAVALDGQSVSVGAPYEDDGGDAAGADYLLDLPVGGPQVTRQPSSLRVALGERASFTAAAVGPAALSYRWQKDGQDLADGNGVSGSATPRLVIEAAGAGDPGLYRCVVSCDCGSATSREATLFVDGVLGVGNFPAGPRLEFVGNHPNPFGASTRIEFRAPTRGRVKVEIFGLRGELVARLLDQEVGPGLGSVAWTGTSPLGRAVPSGLYVCRISGFGQEARRKLTLLR